MPFGAFLASNQFLTARSLALTRLAMEMHLDIRKHLVNERTVQRGAEVQARKTGFKSLLQR